jgi:mycothiol system anti-sigma-R factor
MDCDDCVDRLFAFLDTELSEDEVKTIRAHLEGCDDCEPEYVLEARFLERLRECCTSDVAPAELRQRVILRLRSASPPTP